MGKDGLFQLGLVIERRTIARKIRQAELDHNGADVPVFEFDCRGAAISEPFLERFAMSRFVERFTAEMLGKHFKIIAYDFLAFEPVPIVATLQQSAALLCLKRFEQGAFEVLSYELVLHQLKEFVVQESILDVIMNDTWAAGCSQAIVGVLHSGLDSVVPESITTQVKERKVRIVLVAGTGQRLEVVLETVA
ncbi:MAG: hypothetical protein RQ826_12355 [Xanthomonadales bacterium]|nr:hypothetical protein [Xanthomonadales bacterium]